MNNGTSVKSPVPRAVVLIICVVVAGLRAQGQSLFYATSSATQGSNSVEHVNPAGTANAFILAATGSGGNNVSRCTAIALDSSLQKLFLVDAGNQDLWSINMDGTSLSLVRANLTNTPTDLALDTVNQKIYYTTSSATQGSNTIQRMDYTGGNNIVLFTAGASGNNAARCTALALDLKNSLIVFSDAGVNGLWSLNLSGSGLTLIQSNLLAVPLGLALDVTNQLVYYTTSSAGQNSNTVQCINYAGTVNTLLFTATGIRGNGVCRCSAIDFDPATSKLYLSDAGMNALWSLNSNGTGLTQIESNLLPSPRRVRFTSIFAPLLNGGFETGDFTGWTTNGNLGSCLVTASSPYVHSGQHGAQLGPVGSLGYLSQTLATTAGSTYLLSFWLNSPNGAAFNEFLVSWNGTTLLDQTNIGAIGWTNIQFMVTATSSSTVLQFGFRDDPSYLGLDDISVVPVTESPDITGISLTGNNLVLNGVNGLSNATYYVLMGTNLALPINQWTPVATNTWTANGDFNLTISNAVNGSVPANFYILQIP
jgi:hypothetical protein